MKIIKYPHQNLVNFIEKQGICTKLSTYPHKKMLITVHKKNLILFVFHYVNMYFFINIKKQSYPQFDFLKNALYTTILNTFFLLYSYPQRLLKLLNFYIKKERY